MDRLVHIRSEAAQHLQTDDDITYLLNRVTELEVQIANLAAENREYERALGLNDNP